MPKHQQGDRSAPVAKAARLPAAVARQAFYLLQLRDDAKRLRDSIAVENDFPDVTFAADLHHHKQGKSNGFKAEPLCMPRAVACDWLQGLIERTEQEILALGVDL